MKIMTTLLIFISLQGCASVSENDEVQTVSSIDISKYMGKWYVIANIPLPLEGDLVNSTETYSWNDKEDRIDVDYQGYKDSPDGELKKFPQKAFIHDKETNAHWKVQFFWPFKFSYLIVDIDKDYSYTIVAVPSRKYAWIMSRTPKMTDAVYDGRVEKLKQIGYDVSKLKKVLQKWPAQ